MQKQKQIKRGNAGPESLHIVLNEVRYKETTYFIGGLETLETISKDFQSG